MLFASILFAMVTIFSAVLASDAEKCSKRLAAIVYNVEVPQAGYMARISKVLLVQHPLLFSSTQSVAVFQNFVNTFQVGLKVIDPFGLVTIYQPGVAPTSDLTLIEYQTSNWARSFLNQPSFKVRDGTAYYTFGVFQYDSQYLAFTIFEQANYI